MFEPLVPTKLYLPATRSGWIVRPRLLARFDNAHSARLVLVSAPAGYGKTTLITSWLRGLDSAGNVHVGWLALDEADNEPRRFFRYLAAIVTTYTGEPSSLTPLLDAEQIPAPGALMATLIRDVAPQATRFILVFDDYHLLDAPELDDALAFLLEHMPPQMTLVLTSRSDPGFPIARLRARRELIEIRADDLRFSAAEAQQFLRETMGLSLPEELARVLENRTEGWIAGLQMAALSLQERQQEAAALFVDRFAGSHRFVLDYLVDEALGRQPERIRTFLLATSILDRLSGPLCAAVTQYEDAEEILASLEHNNLFVVPLDDRRRWYRYHHLFADVLQAHAGAERPEQTAIWHARAGNWYIENDRPADAIRHMLAAGNMAPAADLLEIIRPAVEGEHHLILWLTWVRALPAEMLQQRPVLCAGVGWALLEIGELVDADAHLRLAEKALWEPDAKKVIADADQWATLPASLAGARAYLALATGNVDASVRHSRDALAFFPDGDTDQWRRAALSLLGLATWIRGDLTGAARSFAELSKVARTLDKVVDEVSTTYVLADMYIAQGELNRGESAIRHILADLRKAGAPAPPGASDLHRVLAVIAWERNQPEQAQEALNRAEELGEVTSLTNWPFRFFINRADIQQSRGDYGGALASLEQADRHFVENPLPVIRTVGALRAHIYILQGRLDEAEAWARQANITPDDEPTYLRSFDHLVLARLLLARAAGNGDQAEIAAAIHLLARMESEAQAAGRTGGLRDILIVQACAYAAADDQAGARIALERALALAEPQGYIRGFVDEGPALHKILRVTLSHSAHADHIRSILAVVGSDGDANASAPPSQALIEPLSGREQEILLLIVEGYKNKEIAEQLMISLNTVLYHTKNLYGKLGVNKRARAIAKARELHLID